MPKTDSSGLFAVLSVGFSVHGRRYTERRRAFSSGENSGRGTLAKDHVGK